MKETLRGLVIAPAPVFLLLCLILVKPSFGWSDAMFGVGLALTYSYGFMLTPGLSTHLVLRRCRL